jgi:hypothetical protein
VGSWAVRSEKKNATMTHHQIHALDKFTTAAVEPVPEYVEDRREDLLASPHHDDLPMDGSEDELWANLGVNLRDCRAE